MIRRPPRSTLDRSSAASDVYKRQGQYDDGIHLVENVDDVATLTLGVDEPLAYVTQTTLSVDDCRSIIAALKARYPETVSYTHLRAHETVLDLVCRLLLEKTKTKVWPHSYIYRKNK